MSSSNVAIIGAGPAGVQAALRLKEEGFDSIIFEEHEKIGMPEHCSGLISKSGVDALKLHLSDTLLTEIKGARLHSPNGTMLEVKRNHPVAYVVNRCAFDQMLVRKARLNNIHVATHTKLIDVRQKERESTLFVQVDGRGELRKADYIIGADGVNSTVRHLMGINPEKENYIHSIQAVCDGTFDDKMVDVYFGDYAKGFIAWCVPMGKDKAKIGLGATLGEDIGSNFKTFLQQHFPNVKAHHVHSALIPYGAPLTGIAKGKMALVGDAAFHTKATTGGGIIFGMKAANLLGETLAETFKGKSALSHYEKSLAPLYKDLKMHWKIRQYANKLQNHQVDELMMKLKEKGIEEFLSTQGDMDNPSAFIGKLAKNPKYWFMAKTIIDIMGA